MTAHCTILFTSAGRRVELLAAFRRAAEELGVGLTIVATDIDPLAPALASPQSGVDRVRLMPRVNDPDYIPALEAVLREEHVDLLFPLIDPDIPLLARHREPLEATGARLGMCPMQGIGRTVDKWATYGFFVKNEIPAPDSWLPSELARLDPRSPRGMERLPFPLFIKPRQGSAGQHAYKVANPDELRFFLSHVPGPMVSQCLEGPEITADVICGLPEKNSEGETEILGIALRERIEVRWGEVAKGVTYDGPAVDAILDGCTRIARALPAAGPVTVQCMLHGGTPYFTEINARFGGGMPLGIAAGVDAPRWYLARLAGIDVDVPPVGSYARGLYMTRHDTSVFLTEEQLKQRGGD